MGGDGGGSGIDNIIEGWNRQDYWGEGGIRTECFGVKFIDLNLPVFHGTIMYTIGLDALDCS